VTDATSGEPDETGVPGTDSGSLRAGPGSGRLPPDPVAYDSERNEAARRRGLAAPYIPGGRDPDQATANREERRYLKILLLMVIVIVAAGFVLGFAAALAGFNGLVGNPG
jgi:hypothetical protein